MDEDHRLKSVPPDSEDLITVAQIVKVRGLRGEVVADLLTDFPDRFEGLASLIAIAPDGSRRSLQIEERWFHGDRLVLKFAGFDGMEEAKELIGCDLAVPVDERIELPPDSFYEWELIGCRVETISGVVVGQVNQIKRTGGVELLSVVDDAGRDRLVPMVADIVIEIDKEKKLVRIDPPEGLLEL
jgi:16S rRNA processing protein RimM